MGICGGQYVYQRNHQTSPKIPSFRAAEEKPHAVHLRALAQPIHHHANAAIMLSLTHFPGTHAGGLHCCADASNIASTRPACPWGRGH